MTLPLLARSSFVADAAFEVHARRHDLYAVTRPVSAANGDFYLHIERERSVLLGLGDVAGHGLGAAVYMLMIQEEVERLATAGLALEALVADLHATLHRELPSRRFASLVLAELHLDGRLEVLNAGHCQPLLRRTRCAGGHAEVEALAPNGPIVGAFLESWWRSQHTVLAPGETLLFYSDGAVETTSAAGEEYGLERLRAAVSASGGRPPRCLAASILAELDAFRGASRQQDDTTLLVVRA